MIERSEGELISFYLHANDPDGGNVTYSIIGNIPDGAKLDDGKHFVWRPDYSFVKTDENEKNIHIKFLVKDDENTEDTVDIAFKIKDAHNPAAIKAQLNAVKVRTTNLISSIDGMIDKLNTKERNRHSVKTCVCVADLLNSVAIIGGTQFKPSDTRTGFLVGTGLVSLILAGIPPIFYPSEKEPTDRIRELKLHKTSLSNTLSIIRGYEEDSLIMDNRSKLKREMEKLNDMCNDVETKVNAIKL